MGNDIQHCEVGICFDETRGWRCYMSNVDGKGGMAFYTAKGARNMVKFARRRPEAKEVKFAPVFDLFDELLVLADEVEANRKAKKVPDEYLAMATGGRA